MLGMVANNPVAVSANETDLLHRREMVSRLRLQGMSVYDIAERLNVKPGVVSADIRAIQAYWLNRCVSNRNAWMAEALDRLENLEMAAMRAYYGQSPKGKENERTVSDDGTTVKTKQKNWAGDPRLLAIALNCQKQRSILLGLMTKEQARDIDRIGVKKPKMLVIRDRKQSGDLIDVTSIKTVEISEPETAQEENSSEKEPF